MIVAASGVLNVASIGSVFGQAPYKRRARLSGLLCLALLAGGLMVLMLDPRPARPRDRRRHALQLALGVRAERFLYSGMAAIVAGLPVDDVRAPDGTVSKPAGIAAFVWRFVLTTGTGSIFGFVARQAYQSALLAPMFIVLSFAWGLAVFGLVQASMFAWNAARMPDDVARGWRACSASSSQRRCTSWRCTT